MRIRKLYATYDNVAKLYGPMVLPAINDEDAKRSFIMFLQRETDIRKDDLSLFYLGEYDRVDGTLIGIKTPELIINGKDIEIDA